MKRLAFYLLSIVLCYVLLESFVFGIYSLTNHRYFSFENTRKELRIVHKDTQTDRFGQKIIEAKPGLVDIALHPYLGYGPPAGLYEYANDSSEVMVGITGASVSQQFYEDKAAVEELKKTISAIPAYHGRPVHVVNLALAAYKQPQQSIAVMLYLTFGGRLDILINLDGHNEMVDAQENPTFHEIFYGYPTAYFWHDVVDPFHEVGENHAIGKIMMLRMLRQQWADLFEALPPLQYSVTALTLWKYGDLMFDNHINAIEQIRMSMQQDNRLLQGPYTPLDTDELMNRALHVWTEGSLLIQKLSELHEFRYYHFLQPVPNLPGTKPFSEKEQHTVANQREQAMDVACYAKLRVKLPELQKQGVKIYDITDIFSKTTRNIYRDSCCHVNHAGNMAFAQKFGETITQDMAVPKH